MAVVLAEEAEGEQLGEGDLEAAAQRPTAERRGAAPEAAKADTEKGTPRVAARPSFTFWGPCSKASPAVVSSLQPDSPSHHGPGPQASGGLFFDLLPDAAVSEGGAHSSPLLHSVKLRALMAVQGSTSARGHHTPKARYKGEVIAASVSLADRNSHHPRAITAISPLPAHNLPQGRCWRLQAHVQLAGRSPCRPNEREGSNPPPEDLHVPRYCCGEGAFFRQRASRRPPARWPPHHHP